MMMMMMMTEKRRKGLRRVGGRRAIPSFSDAGSRRRLVRSIWPLREEEHDDGGKNGVLFRSHSPLKLLSHNCDHCCSFSRWGQGTCAVAASALSPCVPCLGCSSRSRSLWLLGLRGSCPIPPGLAWLLDGPGSGSGTGCGRIEVDGVDAWLEVRSDAPSGRRGSRS